MTVAKTHRFKRMWIIIGTPDLLGGYPLNASFGLKIRVVLSVHFF
jgi:hypothetical protein